MNNGKIAAFFKSFRARYDAQVIRNQKMDEFLEGAKGNNSKIDSLSHAVQGVSNQVKQLDTKVNNLQEHVAQIDERLKIIGKGAKMELFDTLYHWKQILVDDRGWASKEEKKEVKEIYEVYHDGLEGNGQGEVYYNDIIHLPEKPPEKDSNN